MIRSPDEALAKILEKSREGHVRQTQEMRLFEDKFKEEHGLAIKFDSSALKGLYDKAHRLKTEPEQLAADILESYEHGLKLIQQNTGQSQFIIGEDSIEDPKATLERLVKDSYNELKDYEPVEV